MLLDYCHANLTLALPNWLEVLAIFLELVVVADWFGLPKTEARTAVKAAELGLGLAGDPLFVAARSFDGIDLALQRQ
jgi:hypothetical protein